MKRKIDENEYNSLSDSLKNEYSKGDDGYILNLEGDDDSKKRISEFRENNIRLKKQLEELESKLKNSPDPEEYETIKKQLEEIKEGEMLDKGQFEELHEKRTANLRKDYESQINALKKHLQETSEKASTYSSAFHGMKVTEIMDNSARELKVNFNDGARSDFMDMAKAYYHYDEENKTYIPREPSTGETIYGKGGDKPMSPQEFMEKMVETKPFYFKGSSGTGSIGSGNVGTGSRRILPGDNKGFFDNLEQIASGKVKVVK